LEGYYPGLGEIERDVGKRGGGSSTGGKEQELVKDRCGGVAGQVYRSVPRGERQEGLW